MRTLSFAVVALATAAHAQTIVQTIDERTVSGPRDITGLIVQRSSQEAQPCRPLNEPRVVGYGTGERYRVVFYRGCNEAEARHHMEMWARSVRERLGDRGRH